MSSEPKTRQSGSNTFSNCTFHPSFEAVAEAIDRMNAQAPAYPDEQFVAEMEEREAVPVKTRSGYEAMVTMSAAERDRLVAIAQRALK